MFAMGVLTLPTEKPSHTDLANCAHNELGGPRIARKQPILIEKP